MLLYFLLCDFKNVVCNNYNNQIKSLLSVSYEFLVTLFVLKCEKSTQKTAKCDNQTFRNVPKILSKQGLFRVE